MRKKITGAALVLLMAALLTMSGVTAGARMEVWRSQEKAAFLDAQATAIAILSMDIGAEYQGEQVVFAEEIIASLPAAYTLVSKEVGEKGLAEGTFGALITFPADFSRCLVTINDQRPLAAQFSYKLNMNLPEDGMLEVMTDILELEREVNDRLSYMYIASVFEEFHDAQDRVSAVLSNDEADLAALSQIQSMDLVAKLQLTVLPQEIPEFRAADISEYSSDNQSILSDMGGSYREYLQLAVDDHTKMAEEITATLNDETNGVAAFKKSIDELTWLPDINGKGDSFSYISSEASSAIGGVSGALAAPVLDVSALTDSMSNSTLDLNDYNTALEADLRAMLAAQQQAVLDAVRPIGGGSDPDSDPDLDPPDSYEPTTEYDDLFAILADPLDQELLLIIVEECYAQGKAAGIVEGQNDMIEAFESAELALNPDDFYDGQDPSVREAALAELAAQHETISQDFSDAVNTEATDFNTQVSDAYDGIRDSLSALDGQVSALAAAEKDATQSYGDAQRSSLNAKFSEKMTLIQGFTTALTAYDPLQHITDNQEVFDGYSDRFRKNIADIQTEVSDQVTHDNEQLSALYGSHSEYIETLREDIRVTKEEGDLLLADAVQIFYDAKMETSASNIQNMGEFAAKLPNSRVGNLGNNNIFNFMASPIQSVNSDPLTSISLPGEIQRIEFLHGEAILFLLSGIAIALLLGIIIVFAAMALHDNKARRRYEEQMLVIEPESGGSI